MLPAVWPDQVEYGCVAVWALLWHSVEGDGVVENVAFGFYLLPDALQLEVRLNVQDGVDVVQERGSVKVRVEDKLVRG